MPTSARYLRSFAPLLRWYALAVGSSALALVLMLVLRPLMDPSIFFLFLAAVTVSALYGGLGPGLVATVLSALAANYFFMAPYNAFMSELEETYRLGIFLSTGLIISWLARSHKDAEARLRERNEELERWVAERRAMEEELKRRASHDYLTGLRNYASFHEHLGRVLARARRNNGKVALLYVDLDDFKLVNDSLGHQEGNRVLREVAERLEGCLRESDVAARIGGDEFAVLVEDVADADEAVGVAERLQAQLSVPFDAHGYWLRPSASIGIAVGTQQPPEKWMGAADAAMYQAKRSGKGRSAVFDQNSATGNPD